MTEEVMQRGDNTGEVEQHNINEPSEESTEPVEPEEGSEEGGGQYLDHFATQMEVKKEIEDGSETSSDDGDDNLIPDTVDNNDNNVNIKVEDEEEDDNVEDTMCSRQFSDFLEVTLQEAIQETSLAKVKTENLSEGSDVEMTSEIKEEVDYEEYMLNALEADRTNEMEYFCDKCSYTGTKKSYLIEHKRRVHMNIKFPCDKCDYKATTKPTLRRHKQIHLLEDDELDPEEKAAALIKYEERKKHLRDKMRIKRQHQQNMNNGNNKSKPKKIDPSNLIELICDQCGYRGTRRNLRQHEMSVHLGIKFPCSKCAYQATTKESLKRHALIHLKDDENLDDEEKKAAIEKYENRKKIWRDKMREKRKTNPPKKKPPKLKVYSCEKCDFQSNTKGNLSIHKKSVHNEVKTFICEECDNRQFSTLQALEIHRNGQHLGIKVNCEYCDYRASTKFIIQQHIDSVHLGIRFNCEQCDYSTKNKQVLKDHHRAIHEGLKYQCEFCSFEAGFKSNLRAHIKSNHKTTTVSTLLH